MDDLGESDEVTEEAKQAAAEPPPPVEGAEDLRHDVRDGTIED